MTTPSEDDFARTRQYCEGYTRGEYHAGADAAHVRVTLYLLERVRELEKHRESTVRALQTIVRNDATAYEHHQPRRWDGRTPDAEGGTIWLTPREMARQLLKILGAEVPDMFLEMKARVAARSNPNAEGA